MNDQPDPTSPTEEQPTEPLPPPPDSPKRLVRARSDRMLAGVAGGLGRHFDVDPLIFRIAFGVSVFFGGLGILAYVALWLLVPDEESGEPIVKRSRFGLAAVILVAALVLAPLIGAGIFWGDEPFDDAFWVLPWLLVPFAILIATGAFLQGHEGPMTARRVVIGLLLMAAAVTSFFAIALLALIVTAIGSGIFAAAAVVLCGLALIAGALAGGSWRWLVVPAIALATGVGVAAAADFDFEGGIGERSYSPLTAAAIPDDGYDLGIGHLVVDLRQLDWTAERVIDLDVHLGVGQATIAVPEDVCVVAEARVMAGELQLTGERADGADVVLERAVGSSAVPRLVLDAEVELGQLQVVNLDGYDTSEPLGHHSLEDQAMRDATEAACA